MPADSHPNPISGRNPRPSRRDFILTGTALATTFPVGCRQPSEQAAEPAKARTDVPLRVVLCGTDSDKEVLTRGWSAVSQQLLDVTVVDLDRASTAGLIDQIVAAVVSTDVIIYPQLAVAQLHASNLLTPVLEGDFERAEEQDGAFLAALRNGSARFAGRYIAMPLGANQPALITSEPDEVPEDWADYHTWVGSLDGAVAEPLAGGWAAMMFLWRATSYVTHGWLFARDGLEPQIDGEAYVAALRQMRDTSRLYKIDPTTPEAIWAELESGTLKGGLSFAFGDDPSQGDLTFANPPMEGPSRVLTDPFSPVASLSTKCRQSAASKRFLRWLSGGAGSVRRQIGGMTITRKSRPEEQERPYDGWLRQRLRRPNVIPTLQLLAADEYYAILDQQVTRCLQGEAEPAEVLAETKAVWQRIGERVGLKKQQRAWRQTQGMTA